MKNRKESVDIPGQPTTETLPSYPALLERLLHSLDYIAVLRPLLLMPVWTMLLLGYYKGIHETPQGRAGLPSIGNMPIILHPDKEIFITILLYSLLMGSIYILNQICDSRTDRINGKLYLVAHGYMKEGKLKIQIIILFSVSIIISLLRFPAIYTCLVLLSIVLGMLYSVPPVRLKGRPFLDLFANASGFGFIAFFVGWLSKSAFSTKTVLDCLPYFICISAAFINTTIPDMKGDMQNGDRTTGIFLGIRKSCLVSTILVGAVPFLSLYLRDFICLTASLLSLPFFIYMTISNWNEMSPNISAITLATKVSLMVLSLLTAIFIPFYFVLVLMTVLLMRVYYQARFGISYP